MSEVYFLEVEMGVKFTAASKKKTIYIIQYTTDTTTQQPFITQLLFSQYHSPPPWEFLGSRHRRPGLLARLSRLQAEAAR